MSNISLNFTISDGYSNHSMIVSETYLEEDSIFLEKKHILSRKEIVNERIMFKDVNYIKLIKSDYNSLDLSISISYLDSVIFLKSADSFAVKWFYDELIKNFESFKKKFISKKSECFDNFLNQMNKDISDEEFKKNKKKDKFYNYCSVEER